MKARVYDNGGKTWDRYTLVTPSEEAGKVTYYGASENPYHPQGFGQYCGECDRPRSYKHLGKLVPIESLPAAVQQFVKERIYV